MHATLSGNILLVQRHLLNHEPGLERNMVSIFVHAGSSSNCQVPWYVLNGTEWYNNKPGRYCDIIYEQ